MRQYIGARYVTKIYENSLDPGSCEWESGVVYEPLTIVSYQNSSYLSRTSVPANAGNPAAATTYWAQTGFYNGQIAQLQNEIGTLTDLKTDDKDSLTDAINEIVEKTFDKILLVGDSYVAQSGSVLAEKLQEAFRIPVITAAVSSMGFTHAVDGRTFVDLLTNYSESTRLTVKKLIVYGGINDPGNTYSDEYDAVDYFIRQAKTLYPNAQIYVFGPQATTTSALYPSQGIIVNAIMAAATANGVVHADASKWLMLTPYAYSDVYKSDKVHPTNIGDAIIAGKMLNVINGEGEVNDLTTPLILGTPGDTLHYSIRGNVIDFEFLAQARSYTQNTFDTFFTVSDTIKPYLQMVKAFDAYVYYSGGGQEYFTERANGICTFKGSDGLRFLPSANIGTVRIGVSGSIIIQPEKI